ncbi:MAG: recombination regulator RecX [Lachnospiraceae bacterium]|nr:recombination regulator RecX [Lachnospiraceae bacterium]
MTVTEISEYKKGKYKIYLNDEFAFVLYSSDIKKYRIEPMGELSEHLIEDIKENVLKKRCRAYAMNILKKQDKTVRDLKLKLKDALYTEEIAQDAIDYVRGYNYVDDVRYSENYIRSVCERSGIPEIKRKLMAKGVSGEDIERAVNNCYEEGILNDEKGNEIIRKLLLKKLRSEGENFCKDRERILASVCRKGFSVKDAESVYDTLCEELYHL